MAAYISLDQYKEMGGGADAAAYFRYELKARKLIDAATHNRLAGEDPVRESAKMCAFELIEQMAAQEAESGIGGREALSVSNDGVSVAYSESETQSAAALQRQIIKNWFFGEFAANGVSLLYCGVDG